MSYYRPSNQIPSEGDVKTHTDAELDALCIPADSLPFDPSTDPFDYDLRDHPHILRYYRLWRRTGHANPPKRFTYLDDNANDPYWTGAADASGKYHSIGRTLEERERREKDPTWQAICRKLVELSGHADMVSIIQMAVITAEEELGPLDGAHTHERQRQARDWVKTCQAMYEKMIPGLDLSVL